MAIQFEAAKIHGGVAEHSSPRSSPDKLMYTALSPESFQIRLLYIHSGETVDQIRGDLRVVPVKDCPPYHALSYTWGDDPAPMPMRIGDTEVPIQQNLDRALRNIRKDMSSQAIWIDRLCINQSDLKEKSEQVKQMAHIYRKAQRAIVWLGEADDSFKAACDFLLQLDRVITQSQQASSLASSDQKASVTGYTQSLQDDQTYLSVLRRQHRPTVVIQKLAELLRRPYWERVWIIQEIATAPIVQVRLGPFLVPLYPLLLASKNLRELPERFRILASAIVRFRAQEQDYGESSKTARMPLLDALITSRHSLATDPRDKIYALLGMTVDGSVHLPLLSYEDSVRDVFCKLTSSLIRTKQASNVLQLAHWSPLKEKEPDAPEWSVDWAEIGYHLPPWLVNTTRSTREAIPESPEFDGLDLVVKGKLLARLVGVEGKSIFKERTIASPQKPWEPYKVDQSVAAKVLNHISSDLKSNFDPGLIPFGITPKDITGALSRMIRDVSKQNVSLDYKPLGRDMWKFLHDLGSLSWDERPLWSWAKEYHTFLASGDGEEGPRVIKSPRSSRGSPAADPWPQAPNPALPLLPSPSPNLRAAQPKKSSVPSARGTGGRGKQPKVIDRLTSGRPSSRPQTPLLKVPDTPSASTSPRLTAPHRNAFRFWTDLFSELDIKPEHRLRFAQAKPASLLRSSGHLILVCNDAEIGDLVYQIESSKLPVILRRASGNFYLIGEACLGRTFRGEWTESFKEPANDPFQSEDKLSMDAGQLRIHLNKVPPNPKGMYGMFNE
jgi:hypothetical protein